MSQTLKNKVQKGKVKMFLFFLAVASVLWFLSKFSKEFTATVEAEIHYINLPKKVLLSENNFKKVSFDLTTSGFDFLYYKINDPVVTIDLSNYYKKENKDIVIPKSDFIKLITTQLKKNIAVRNVSINTMVIHLEKLASKKVKVLLSEEIQFEKGYKSLKGFEIVPDSIEISGPLEIIDTIKNVETELVKLKSVKENISKQLKLIIPNENNITFSHDKVDLIIKIEEFTQKTVSLPIIVKNLPNKINLKTIPEIMELTFDVSMNRFNAISEKDFTIICDYNKRNEEGNFMIPQLLKQPDSILNIEFQVSKIDYLIFK